MFDITSDSIHKHWITVMQLSSILRVRSNLNCQNVKLIIENCRSYGWKFICEAIKTKNENFIQIWNIICLKRPLKQTENEQENDLVTVTVELQFSQQKNDECT